MDWTNVLVAIIGGIATLIGYAIVDRREKNKQMSAFKDEVIKTLNDHRSEYIKGIEDVKDDITELRAVTQQTQAVIEIKIDNLEKKQDKHNSVIERTYKLEQDAALLSEQIKVANHRIEDLERK